VFYNPPTTTGFSAPELAAQPPDRRADVYSLGAVLYTMLAGYDWTTGGKLPDAVAADRHVDDELKAILLAAVAAEPAQRQESIEELCSALAGYLESIWPGRSASPASD
jgi:serine/threonine protein kinase